MPSIRQVRACMSVLPSIPARSPRRVSFSSAPENQATRSSLPSRQFLMYFIRRFGPTSAPIDISLRIRRDALGRARAGRPLHRIRNEPCHDAVADSSNSDAALPTVVVLGYRLRFRIGDIDHVLLVDEDTAWAAELEPLIDVVSILVENLDAIVLPVADEEPPARIHRRRVRNIELAGARAFLPPGLDELAVLGEFYDPRIGVAPVSVGDKNVSIGRDQNCRRRIEFVRAVAG